MVSQFCCALVGSSMSMSPDALAATLSRHIDLSNDRRRTLVVLIVGLISARTVNLAACRWRLADRPSFRPIIGGCSASSSMCGWMATGWPRRLWRCCGLRRLPAVSGPNQLEGRSQGHQSAGAVHCHAARTHSRPVGHAGPWRQFHHGPAQALLARFMALFGKGAIKLLLADREFIGNQWFEFLVENDIPFAFASAAACSCASTMVMTARSNGWPQPKAPGIG